jgi:hypothetical protein
MLSEIFILHLEAILRANATVPRRSDTHFVPVKPPMSPTQDQAAGRQMDAGGKAPAGADAWGPLQ